MVKEIEFNKYKKRGAYHWEQDSGRLMKGNAFVSARYSNCVEIMRHACGGLKGKEILDLGCGDGVLTYKFVESGAICSGVDLSKIAIECARREHYLRNSMAEFKCASVYDTGYKNNSFDIVVCSDVIEHLKYPQKLLEEIKRILKPGGKALISTPIRFTEKPLDLMHVVEWYPEEFREMVESVFKKYEWTFSHPLFWLELFSLHDVTRIFVNLLAKVKNPFLSGSKRWKYFCMQYAIVEKGDGV